MNGSQTSERRQGRPQAPLGARPRPPPGGGDGEDVAGLAMARGATGTTMARMQRHASFPTPTSSYLMAMAPRRPPSSCLTAARRWGVARGATATRRLYNVIEQPLWFPSEGGGQAATSAAAQDLIHDLLVNEPQKRIAFTKGATTFFYF
jgi:hypothetical protein